MITHEIQIENGDYLWDNINQNLVIYNDSNSYRIGALKTTNNVNLAFPIPLNEDTLNALGFHDNKNAQYVDKNNLIIDIDGTNKTSILVINDNPVLYVSDVQNIARALNVELNIDTSLLEKACKNRI